MGEQSLKEKTARGLFWGGISNGVAQLLNLLFGIFLARLLTPADYGMVGMLSIFTLLAGALQESGFIAALANKKEVRNEDYNAVFWFSSLTGLSLYILLFFCAPLIARFFDTPELVPLARYIFLSFFLSSLGTAQSAYLFRNLMVKEKAIMTVINQTSAGIVGVTMAYYGMSYWGIATQSIVNVGLATLGYWYFSPWRPTFKIDFSPLKGMIRFSSKLLVTNIFNQINNNIFSVILGKFYSSGDVGYYTQANKWNTMGYSFVSGMIQGVAQPVLSNVASEHERQQRIFRKMLRFTAFVSFPLMFGLSLISKELIVIALTSKWLPSAMILQILCIGGAFVPIHILYSNLLISKGKSNIYMWNNVCIGIIQLVTMLLLYPYGIQTMVITYVCINISWLFIWHFFVWKEIRLTLGSALKDILPFCVASAGVMLLTYYLTLSVGNQYLLIVAKILLAVFLYLLVMGASKSVVFRESLLFLSQKLKNKHS